METIAGNGNAGIQNGLADEAMFHAPHGITVDDEDNIFISDELNHQIRRITPSGVVVTVAGSSTSGDSTGSADNAKFNRPRGLALDSDNNLIVCDYGNDRIKKIVGPNNN